MAKPKPDQSSSANPMWGGHYASGPAEAFAAINPSIGFDWQLYKQDITASLAHCAMLGKQGIISPDEVDKIASGLKTILTEIESGAFEFKIALEDIHMNIESRLAELIGDTSGKLHTARSRNDQVATDFRLYVRDTIDGIDALLKALQAALLNRAEEHSATIMPGFTHLQPAQPITLGHHFMAYAEMFGRDRDRLRDARARMNQSPLGAAALAGTSFPIDRAFTASSLGFAAPMTNSLDAVADRDFVLEPLAAFSLCALHLSRLAEELILWSAPMFSFVKLPESFTSGSSIMPQKRNPDAAELIRGKTGRIIGAMNSLMITLKALPLAYNKDNQEDKEPFFDASKQLGLCLQAMTGMVASLEVNTKAMLIAAQQGYSTATDLADWLVRVLGIPFREAHHITGRIVKLAEEHHCTLSALSLAQMQSVEPRISDDIFSVLSVESSVNSRTSFGGTAPASVREAIVTARATWRLP